MARTPEHPAIVVVKNKRAFDAYKLTPGKKVAERLLAIGAGPWETVGKVKDKHPITDPLSLDALPSWVAEWAGDRKVISFHRFA